MENVISAVETWGYWEQLPSVLAGFSLVIEKRVEKERYYLFSYKNPERWREFGVLYDKATKEYIARITVGLTEYCDMRFMTTELGVLEIVIKNDLESTLEQLRSFHPENVELMFREKEIIEWAKSYVLPEIVAGFSLYISPQEPVKIINGSYIIIDYSDFSCESNLIIYYNVFRDEFFGEVRLHRTPYMAGEFEAKTLKELSEKLMQYLDVRLHDMRKKCDLYQAPKKED